MKKKIRRGLALFLVKTLILIARLLPRRTGLSLFSRLGKAAFRLYGKDRECAIRNISLAFPASDSLIVRAIARGSFSALGRNALDALRLTFISREQVLELCMIDGEEHLRSAHDEGKGVVALSGHIGCWEMMGAYLAEKGYKINVIAKDLRDGKLNEMLVDMRKRRGVVSIPRGSGAVTGYRALRKGQTLGMLIDQDIDVDGVFVPFFGIPAHTPRGAAVFALRSGAPVVPMAIHMQPDGMHRISVLPRLELPPEDLPEQERIDELTLKCSGALERLIRIYPQQWVWFHDRWKTRPGPEDRVFGTAGSATA